MQVLFYAIHFIAFIDKKQDIFSSFSQTNRRHTFAVGLFHRTLTTPARNPTHPPDCPGILLSAWYGHPFC